MKKRKKSLQSNPAGGATSNAISYVTTELSFVESFDLWRMAERDRIIAAISIVRAYPQIVEAINRKALNDPDERRRAHNAVNTLFGQARNVVVLAMERAMGKDQADETRKSLDDCQRIFRSSVGMYYGITKPITIDGQWWPECVLNDFLSLPDSEFAQHPDEVTLDSHRRESMEKSKLDLDELRRRTEKSDEPTVLFSNGDRWYFLAGEPAKRVSPEADALLHAFLRADGRPLTTSELEKVVTNVAKTISRLEDKFPGVVVRPPKRNVGYRILVREVGKP